MTGLKPNNNDPEGRQAKSTPMARALGVAAAMGGGYAVLGVSLPFLPRWLEVEGGLTGVEIGFVVSSAPLLRIVLGPMIALWADGFADRRRPLQLLTVAALIAYGVFWNMEGFAALLIAGVAAITLATAVSPLLEGAALRAGYDGALPFGVIRGLGSAAFIVANVLGGFLIARFGAGAVMAWIICNLAVNVVLAHTVLPPDPVRATGKVGGFRARLAGAGALLARPRIRLLLAAAGLIQGAHAFYYGFSVLVWRDQGIDAGLSGALWGFSVACEIVLLVSLGRIERVFSPVALIAIGAGASVLRWAGMACAPEAALLWPLQALHALTFAAAHVGTLRILHAEAGETQAAISQTLYAALGSGVVFGAASMASGYLYESAGAGGYWIMAAMALVGLAFTLALWRVPPTPTPPVPEAPPLSPPSLDRH